MWPIHVTIGPIGPMLSLLLNLLGACLQQVVNQGSLSHCCTNEQPLLHNQTPKGPVETNQNNKNTQPKTSQRVDIKAAHITNLDETKLKGKACSSSTQAAKAPCMQRQTISMLCTTSRHNDMLVVMMPHTRYAVAAFDTPIMTRN